jgi:hypothetical protein
MRASKLRNPIKFHGLLQGYVSAFLLISPVPPYTAMNLDLLEWLTLITFLNTNSEIPHYAIFFSVTLFSTVLIELGAKYCTIFSYSLWYP